MKRKDILKKLKAAGLTFEEGGSHTRVLDAQGNMVTAVPRHQEILETTAKGIFKQADVKLK